MNAIYQYKFEFIHFDSISWTIRHLTLIDIIGMIVEMCVYECMYICMYECTICWLNYSSVRIPRVMWEITSNLPQSGAQKNPISPLRFNKIQVGGTSPPIYVKLTKTKRFWVSCVCLFNYLLSLVSLTLSHSLFLPHSLFTSPSIFRMLF